MQPSTNTTAQEYTAMMLDHTTVGIAVFDEELRLQSANALYLQILHAFFGDQDSFEGYLGQSISEWGRKSNDRVAESIFHQVITTGIPHHTKEIMLHSPLRGNTYWDWVLTPICDCDGHVTHIVQTISDVTEHVVAKQDAEATQFTLTQVNQTITEEREQLKIITTIASSISKSLDIQHMAAVTMETVKKHLAAWCGCLYIADPERRVLRTFYELVPEEFKGTFDPLHYIPYERLTFARDVLTSHKPIVIEDLQAAAPEIVSKKDLLRRAGTRGYICIPLWYDDYLEGMFVVLFTRPVQANGRELKALEGCSTHIASALAHGRLNAELERHQSRMRSSLNHIPDGVLIVEATTGTISYANAAAAQYLGIPLEKLSGSLIHQYATLSPFINIIDGKPIMPWDYFIVRALCSEVIKGKETLITRPDGSRAFMLASCAPLLTENNIMTETVIVFQDITSQKTLEQHKSEFLSIANHELRTPITIIQGFAELLQLKAPQIQEQSVDSLSRYALTSIVDQSQHLTHLIEEMLNISRIEQGQFTLRCEILNLVTLLQNVIERQSITNHCHELQLVLDGIQPDDVVMGYLDEERIVQALNNLINNAIKYTIAPSIIEVGLRYTMQNPHEALIWVKDQGMGISQEELPHIFERFHRARNADQASSGFGIGLYLVKEIITRHNGEVWAESTEGKGSTFYVLLPLKSLSMIPGNSIA